MFVQAETIAASKFAAFHIIEDTMAIGEFHNGAMTLVDMEDAGEFGKVVQITSLCVKFPSDFDGDRIAVASEKFGL